MTTQRRIVPVVEFLAAVRALACPNARRMVRELAGVLVVNPHCGQAMDGSEYHVLHTSEYEGFPALRLYYRFDDEAVYLLDVERYDPLLPDEVSQVHGHTGS